MAEFCEIRRGFGSSKNEESEKAKMMECVRFGGETRKEQFRAGSDSPRQFVPRHHHELHDCTTLTVP
jgi:hypothetical protein